MEQETAAPEGPAGEEAVATTPANDDTDALREAYDRIMARDSEGDGGEPEPADEADEGEGADKAPSKTAEGPEPKPAATLPQRLRDIWAGLSPEQQKAISETQGELQAKLAEQGRTTNAIKPVHDALVEMAREDPRLASASMKDVVKGVKTLARLDRALGENPAQAILGLIDQHGVGAQVAQYLGMGNMPPDVVQHVQSLESQIAALKRHASPEAIAASVREATQQQQVEAQIKEFVQTAEHWRDVEPYMVQAVAFIRDVRGEGASPAQIMQEAYDLAVRQFVTDAKKATPPAPETAPETNPDRAAAAKKAKSINVSGTQSGKARELSEQEELGRAYDRIMARA